MNEWMNEMKWNEIKDSTVAFCFYFVQLEPPYFFMMKLM